MSDAPPTWVLCGTATHADAPPDALRITLGGQSASMTVNIDGLGDSLAAQLPAESEDLIRIAAFVLGADGAVVRGREHDVTDERWSRRFRFVIDVANPAFWNQDHVTTALERVLGFLSQDTFRFEFQARRVNAGERSHAKQLVFTGLDGKSFVSRDDVQDISMFSGGLDSFAGAVDLVLRQRRSAILVTHKSATKVWRVQQQLVEGLCEAARAAGAPAPTHVAVDIQKHDLRLRPERTQRTRSFLYAALAGAVANVLGRDRVLMYENGVIAINLPLSGSVVGSRATRTAHPRSLAGFAELLSLVARREVRVHNPFALKTRTEIIAELDKSPALYLAKKTLSCAHASTGTTENPQCGRCSQCIDRQFGFVAANMQQHDDPHSYGVKLDTDEWDERSRQLLLGWIAQADRLAACPDAQAFIESFGEASRAFHDIASMFGTSVDAAAKQVFEMHKRHGMAVAAAIEALSAKHASRVRQGGLKANSMLMLLFRQGVEKQVVVPPPPDSAASNQFLRHRGAWRIRFRDGAPFDLIEPKGLQWLCCLIASPGRVFTAAELWALSERRDPEGSAGLTEAGRQEILVQKRFCDSERRDADAFADPDASARWSAAANELDAAIERSKGQHPPSDREVSTMKKHLLRAAGELRKHSQSLGRHLDECLHIGNVFWYAGNVVEWAVDQPLFMPARGSARNRRSKNQLIGWNEILPAVGRENTRSDRELVKKLNEDFHGPIRNLRDRRVIANEGLLTKWWQSLDGEAAQVEDKVKEAEVQTAATDSALSNPGVRKELGFHDKERPNTRKRHRG